VHPDAADQLARLPAPVPDELPGPAGAAEGAAVGAQQPRRERPQRAGRLVAAAAPQAHHASGRGTARLGLDQRGIRERRPVGQVPGVGARDGRVIRRGAGSGRRAGRRGAHGGDPHRRDRGVRPDRPAGRAPGGGRRRRYRTGGGRLQDRPPRAERRRRSQLARPGAVRDLRRPRAAAGLPAGRATPPADRAGA
jgi:hypothetical protein